MILYQFILETHPRDGVNSYEQKEFVLAPDDPMASRFAREFAQHRKPNATHDTHLDIYFAPEGWPQWSVAQCEPITHLTVPVAGQPHAPNVRIALVPEMETNP